MTESDSREQELPDFTIAGGGLFTMLMQRVGLADRLLACAALFVAVAWLPLLILTFSEGLAVKGVRIPFLGDYGAYGRLLVAIPVLIFAEAPIGWRSRQVLQEFITSRFVADQDLQSFNAAVRSATRLKESILPEIVILGIIYATTAIRIHHVLTEPLTTWYRMDGSFTSAGWYYAFISLPIFQFLLLRWVWKLIVWTILLWRISRLDLQFLAIHPDKMGGLGFLGLAQIPFGIIGFAGGAIISAYLANGMVYRGVSLVESGSTMVIYVVLAVLVILAPILVFTGKLVRLRANGILRYGDIGEEYARLFQRKWVDGINPEGELILGSSDIQSLADLKNSFDIVQNMSIVAADRKTITVIAVSVAAPMIPLFFIALPFEEIIARILGILA